MRELPTGTVTFLFTDIEGSTRLLDELGDAYAAALAEHRRALRAAFAAHGGVEVDTQGDAFFVAFARASDAVGAAAEGQAALAGGPIRVRMGLHTGEPAVTEEGYVGLDVHRAARIAAAGHGAQVLVSQTTRDLVEADLHDLGEHRLKDLSAPERLYQLGEGEFPRLKTLYATNLPVQPNALVGRRRELREIGSLLSDGTRLLTLTGAGGSGKTRLALHAAAEQAERFSDGIWFVPLAPVTDPTLVESTVAQVVGVRGELRDELRSKCLLLVLDNLEQLLDASPFVAELLASAPELRILVTSRERLAIAAEQEYVVPTLETPEAVALFVERARRLQPEFEPDDCVVAIAERLDGLPLALELAAARVKVLTTQQIHERLGHSLELLTGGGRDAPERQRTLCATIEWSYALLAETERPVFDALAAFAGSFSLDAAEAVCGADVDTLGSLVDKSLLRRRVDGRFFMLQTIREFALERLALGDGETVRRRLARFFTELVCAASLLLRSPQEAQQLEVFLLESDNVRVALDVLEASDDPEGHARLAAACWYFWYLSGRFREGRERLEPALARTDCVDAAARAALYDAVAGIDILTGETARARPFAEQSLRLRRASGDEHALLQSLHGFALATDLDGDLDSGRSAQEELVALATKLNEPWWLAIAKGNLGCLLLHLGDLEAARKLLGEALVLAPAHGNEFLAGATTVNLAAVELELGEVDSARARLRSVLGRAEQLPELVTWSFVWLAAADAIEGRVGRAARLVGAVERLTAETGYVVPRMEQSRLDGTRKLLLETMPQDELDRARAIGAALSLVAAIEEALADA